MAMPGTNQETAQPAGNPAAADIISRRLHDSHIETAVPRGASGPGWRSLALIVALAMLVGLVVLGWLVS